MMVLYVQIQSTIALVLDSAPGGEIAIVPLLQSSLPMRLASFALPAFNAFLSCSSFDSRPHGINRRKFNQ